MKVKLRFHFDTTDWLLVNKVRKSKGRKLSSDQHETTRHLFSPPTMSVTVTDVISGLVSM